jgi:hypothetical protein
MNSSSSTARPQQGLGNQRQRRMISHQRADPGFKGFRCRLAHLQPEPAQRAPQAQLDIVQLALQQLTRAQQRTRLLRRQ